MIKTFGGEETQRLYRERVSSRRFRSFQDVAYRKLLQLNNAEELRHLAAPGNRLEKLGGDRKGQYSIRVNDQWRICFTWNEGDAYDVKITDYHYGLSLREGVCPRRLPRYIRARCCARII